MKKIEKGFGGRDGDKLVKMAPKTFAVACKELFDGMKPMLNKSSGPGLLKEYSPWLHNFHASSSDLYTDTIEVPGNQSAALVVQFVYICWPTYCYFLTPMSTIKTCSRS